MNLVVNLIIVLFVLIFAYWLIRTLISIEVEEKNSDWFTMYFCVDCKKRLSYSKVMYSHGVCPHCGYKGPDACTIVDTYEKSGRWVDGKLEIRK
jgi:predicted RNA-binding Zn-ribbon protein involved in translation (DUF1610 family)